MERVILFCFLAGSASATDYYVDWTGGSDGNAGTSSGAAWKSISKVASASYSAGDNIFFKRGETWRTNLYVTFSGASGNPITLDAYGSGALPTVDVGTTNSRCISLSSVSNLMIKNMMFKNPSQIPIYNANFTTNVTFDGVVATGAATLYSGVTLNDSASITILNSWSTNNGAHGFTQHELTTAIVSNCVFSSNVVGGIDNIDSAVCYVYNSTLNGNQTGIWDQGTNGYLEASGCTCDGNSRDGLRITGGAKGHFTNDTFINSEWGVYMNQDAGSNTFLVQCFIGTNWDYGIEMDGVSKLTCLSNTWSGSNTFGVWCTANSTLTNWWGLYLDCAGCKLTGASYIFGGLHYGDAASSQHNAYLITANLVGAVENCYVNSSSAYAFRSDSVTATFRNCAARNCTSGMYFGSAATWQNSIDDGATIPTGNGDIRNVTFSSTFESLTPGNSVFAVPKTTGVAYLGGATVTSLAATYFNGVLLSSLGTNHIGANGIVVIPQSSAKITGATLRNAVIR